MDITSFKNIKNKYADILASDKTYIRTLENLVMQDDELPISNFVKMNAEDAPSYTNEERELQEILLDLNSLNNGIIEIKDYIDSMFQKIDSGIENVRESITEETERIKDINKELGSINYVSHELSDRVRLNVDLARKYLPDNKLGGPGHYSQAPNERENIDNRTIGAKNEETVEIPYEIVEVSGNGISGNLFVYNDNKFENESNDCSNVSLISDESEVSGYVYERLTTNDRNEVIDGIINYDDKEVRCVVTLKANQVFCKLKYLTETTDLIVENIETSADGYSWISRASKPIKNNDVDMIYNDSTYIYGSNIICFPYSMYVRLTFSSNVALDNVIAIEDEDENVDVYRNTKRKSIKLNKITLYSTSYSDTDIVSVDILESGSVDKISLFASEYIPDHFPSTSSYFNYYLIINGEEYEVVPVNSGRPGTKIIKYSEVADKGPLSEDLKLVEETIKSAKLKISIKSYNGQETAYVSNLKMCLGKDTGSIYV